MECNQVAERRAWWYDFIYRQWEIEIKIIVITDHCPESGHYTPAQWAILGNKTLQFLKLGPQKNFTMVSNHTTWYFDREYKQLYFKIWYIKTNIQCTLCSNTALLIVFSDICCVLSVKVGSSKTLYIDRWLGFINVAYYQCFTSKACHFKPAKICFTFDAALDAPHSMA